MNYFALAGGIIAGLFALNGVISILRVGFGKARWRSGWAFPFHVLATAAAAAAAATAAWLFGMVGA